MVVKIAARAHPLGMVEIITDLSTKLLPWKLCSQLVACAHEFAQHVYTVGVHALNCDM